MVTNIYYRMMNAPRRRGLQLGSLHGGGLDVVLDLVEGSLDSIAEGPQARAREERLPRVSLLARRAQRIGGGLVTIHGVTETVQKIGGVIESKCQMAWNHVLFKFLI